MIFILKVFEAFSGIGSQKRALNRFPNNEVVATCDWDVKAIVAYDIIHHGKPNLDLIKDVDDDQILDFLLNSNISFDGKKPASSKIIQNRSKEFLRIIYAAIIRSNNQISITDVKGKDIDYFKANTITYSFPCQDLSLAGNWHGNNSGIDKKSDNRSNMLWQIQRILDEMIEENYKLPKMLLMENVTAILSPKHKKYFKDWENYLNKIGYSNQILILDSSNFGIPQSRKRFFMISVLTEHDKKKEKAFTNYFFYNDLHKNSLEDNLMLYNLKNKKLNQLLDLETDKEKFKNEILPCIPNYTESRTKIYDENDILASNNKVNPKFDKCRTITTKQDRNPNSGIIELNHSIPNKSNFRYLTPRECLKLMGFIDEDYERLIKYNFKVGSSKKFFNLADIYKFAGNSIVVNVLEAIFYQMNEIDEILEKIEKNI